jgi:hypothetical protein
MSRLRDYNGPADQDSTRHMLNKVRARLRAMTDQEADPLGQGSGPLGGDESGERYSSR